MQSYYQEILPYIPRIITPENLTCRSTEELEGLRKYIAAMVEFHVLDSQTGTRLQENIGAVLRQTQQYLRNQATPAVVNGKETSAPGSGKRVPAQVVLVEKRDAQSLNVSAGFIVPLHVIIDPLSDQADQDIITFNNTGISNNDILFVQINLAFRYAKTFILGKGEAENTFFHAAYQFPNLDAAVMGGSLGLAACLQTIAELSRICGHRFAYEIQPDVAFTGALDGQGNVSRIAPDSLPCKLAAVYHSPIHTLVIPRANRKDIASARQKLAGKFPHKNLSLKTPETIVECLNDNEIIKRRRRSWPERFHTRRFRRHIFIAVLGAIAFFAIVLAGFLLTDDNPVMLKANGNNIQALNTRGRILWESPFDQEQDMRIAFYDSPPFIIQDFDQDGKNEIIFKPTRTRDSSVPHLIFYNSDGTVRWTYQEKDEPVFGTTRFNPRYNVGLLKIIPDGEKTLILSVFYHEPYYPAKIILFDPQGQVLQTAWNPGYIYGGFLIDENNDGEKELFLAGTHNDFNRGILLIFSPHNVAGATPADNPEYALQGSPPSTAKYIIRFGPVLPLFHIAGREEIMRIGKEVAGKYQVNMRTTYRKILLTLDSDFAVVGLEFTDVFISRYNQETGQVFDRDEWYEPVLNSVSQIEFWDGFQWVDKKTMNYYYN